MKQMELGATEKVQEGKSCGSYRQDATAHEEDSNFRNGFSPSHNSGSSGLVVNSFTHRAISLAPVTFGMCVRLRNPQFPVFL